MSKKTLKLKVVTPEKLILEEEVEQVVVPTTEGNLGILPEHIPLIATLKAGDVVAKFGGEDIPMAIVGGFLEVRKDRDGQTNVAVLADFAEHVSVLTDEAVEEAKAKAQEMKQKMEDKDHVDFEHFATELERSLTRVKVADKWRRRKYRKF